jgi:lipoprotein-anchoring transpeptidase ErfK/SrfK
MRSSLESKTVRPGLLAYSSYHSDRHPVSRTEQVQTEPRQNGRKLAGLLFFAAIALGLFLGFRSIVQQQSNNIDQNSMAANSAAAVAHTNQCANNNLSQFIVVSIGQRHLWACQNHKVVYSTPVVTGIEYLAADKTPTGTYHISAKQTNTTLTGSDTTGNWSDPVSYWMPFLDNQYGTYGFHDATWRPSSAFGHINPNSAQASHGCVELPLAASKWLYGWAQVGTTVTVEN